MSTSTTSSSSPTPISTSSHSSHTHATTSSAHPLPLIPFSDLILKQELGRGHFGRVLLADYLGTQVAAKEVFHGVSSASTSAGATDASTGSEFAKYFEREVDTLTAARHPNCVQFMGIAHDPATHKDYILTEYLPGGNLADHWIHDLVGKPQLPWRVRVGFAIDVARALAYLHARDIMHRDLKGQNLLVTENRRVKVCDFGLARVRATTAEERKRMSFCGTDAYMAPEIMLCTDFDASVDTFSYGVFLLELITRRAADLFPRPPQLGLAVDTEALVTYRPAECPPALWSLASECVDADPKQRPTWKHVLGVLGECEVELVKQEVDEASKPAAPQLSEHAYPGSVVVHVGAEVVADERLEAAAVLGPHSRTRSDMALVDSAAIGAGLGGSLTDLSMPATRTGSTEALNGSDGGLASASPTSPLTPGAGATGGLPAVVVPHRFSLLQPPSMDKCRLCKKRFGMHRRLVCDDCGYACHRKCVTLVPPNCELKGGIKHYHERYLEDMLRRAAGSAGASPSRPSGSTPV